MKLTIVEQNKKDIFLSMFQLLKNCASIINIIFIEDHIYIQGMDKSHVCLFDITIYSNWFSAYEYNASDSNKICIDTQILCNVLSIAQEHQSIEIHYEGNEPENIHIDLITTGLSDSTKKTGYFDKFFKLPLSSNDADLLFVPTVDYDVEFSITAKKICEIAGQLLLFGNTINIKCTEEKIDLISSGGNGDMTVNIPIDDLSEFSISEGEIINLHYSLNYIQKMCLTTKLAGEIEFSISQQFPLKINYNLGENSSVSFFIAPKVE